MSSVHRMSCRVYYYLLEPRLLSVGCCPSVIVAPAAFQADLERLDPAVLEFATSNAWPVAAASRAFAHAITLSDSSHAMIISSQSFAGTIERTVAPPRFRTPRFFPLGELTWQGSPALHMGRGFQ